MGVIYLKNKNNDETTATVNNLTITRNLNQLTQLSFDFLVTQNNQVADLMMIPFTLVTVPETGELFRITTTATNPLGKVNSYSVSAVSVAHELSYKYLDNKLMGSHSLHGCLDMIMYGTPFKYVIHDTFNNYSFSDGFGGDTAESLLLNTLVSDFKFEFYFNNYTLHIYKRLGKQDAFSFVTGLNAKYIQRTEDYSGIATHIKGLGKQADDGHYLAKAEYTSPTAAQWGIIDAPTIQDDRFTSNESLLAYIKSQLQDYPLVQYTVDQVSFNAISGMNNDIKVGNTGLLKDRYGTFVDARIISVTEHPQDQNLSNTVSFGNRLYSHVEERVRQNEAFKRNAALGKEVQGKLASLASDVESIRTTGIWYEYQ